jgi:hypothetical protein
MASIWKELLFMHGHFVRPEDLLDHAYSKAAQAAAQRDALPRTEPVVDADGLACGGCR